MIVGLGISLSGCFGGCGAFVPVEVSKNDKLTEGTARQILKNNEYGYELQCPAFKPKGGFLSR